MEEFSEEVESEACFRRNGASYDDTFNSCRFVRYSSPRTSPVCFCVSAPKDRNSRSHMPRSGASCRTLLHVCAYKCLLEQLPGRRVLRLLVCASDLRVGPGDNASDCHWSIQASEETVTMSKPLVRRPAECVLVADSPPA